MPHNPYDLSGHYADVLSGFIAESRRNLLGAMARIDHCLDQLSLEQLWWRPRPEMNAIGNLMLHLSGTTAQWIVSAVENAPSTRNRPSEFAERGPIGADVLRAKLKDAVDRAICAMDSIKTAGHLLAPRHIQGHDTNVLTAIYHSVSHFEGHAQEIICMTRQMLGEEYRFLWMPRTPEQVSAT